MLGFSPGNGFLSFLGKNKNPKAKSISYGGAKPGIADIPGLTAALDGKANASHTQAQSTITGLVSALAAKATATHGHAQSDITGLVLALAAKADSVHGHAQSDIIGLVDALADRVTNAALASLLSIADGQESVNYPLSYVKSSAPTGVAAGEGELCLDTVGKKLYEFTTGAWDAGTTITSGQRFWFMLAGTDTSGNSGTHTPNCKIYDYNGTTIDQITLSFGAFAAVQTLGKYYWYNGSVVAEFPAGSILAHKATHIKDGTDEIAGEDLAVTYAPSHYTPTEGGKLSNHLEGIDDRPALLMTSNEITGIQNSPLPISGDNPVAGVGQNWIIYHKDAKVLHGNTIYAGSYREFYPHQLASYQDPAAINDEFEYYIYSAAARVTNLRFWVDKANNHGQLTWTLNGAVLGTYDSYSSGYSQHSLVTINNVNLVAGKNILNGKVAGKNASSSNYAMTLYGVCFGA